MFTVHIFGVEPGMSLLFTSLTKSQECLYCSHLWCRVRNVFTVRIFGVESGMFLLFTSLL